MASNAVINSNFHKITTANATTGIPVDIGVPGNLTVSGKSNLGSISNITITGGTAGLVLSTDGAGALTWVAQGGSNITNNPGSPVNSLQYNSGGAFGGVSTATFNGTVLSLGSNAQVSITGGTTGQVLSTDGSGGLTWSTVGGTGTVTSVGNATVDPDTLGFTLGGGPITAAGTLTLNVPTAAALRGTLGIANIGNYPALNGNGSTLLAGNGDWVSAGSGTVTSVGNAVVDPDALGFNLSGGPITAAGTLTLAVPTAAALRGTLGISNIGNYPALDGNVSNVLRGDGTWSSAGGGGGSGTVTSISTDGSGLGFSLSGGPITTTGTVTLNTPSDTALRTSLNIGNIANVSLDGNVSNVLRGDGTWTSAGGGGGSPGGSNTQIQYNNAGSFDASANLTYNSSTGTTNVANLQLNSYQEVVVPLTLPANFQLRPDFNAGTIFKFLANSSFNFPGFANASAGKNAIVIIEQDDTGGRLMFSTMKFAGGQKTLSTAPYAIDTIAVFYDGSTYYASLITGYA